MVHFTYIKVFIYVFFTELGPHSRIFILNCTKGNGWNGEQSQLSTLPLSAVLKRNERTDGHEIHILRMKEIMLEKTETCYLSNVWLG